MLLVNYEQIIFFLKKIIASGIVRIRPFIALVLFHWEGEDILNFQNVF
jgi:hypothetical protein